MNNTLIPSPIEFNQITDFNTKKKILDIFRKINDNIEFIKR